MERSGRGADAGHQLFETILGITTRIFDNRLIARALARHRHQVGDLHRLGQAFVRGNLVHRAQMGIQS